MQIHRADFTKGEASPTLSERFELEAYGATSKTVENMIVLPQGPLVKRPGFVDAGVTVDNSGGYSGGLRLIAFETAPGEHVLIQFQHITSSETQCRITVEAQTFDVALVVAQIRFRQVNDVIFIADGVSPPLEGKRHGAADWTWRVIAWDFPPLRDWSTSGVEMRIIKPRVESWPSGGTFHYTGQRRVYNGKVYVRTIPGYGSPATSPELWREAGEKDYDLEARAPAWVDGKCYHRGDAVMTSDGTFYLCQERHASDDTNYPPGAFATWGPEADKYWKQSSGGSPTTWAINTAYTVGSKVAIDVSGTKYAVWECTVAHTSSYRNVPPILSGNLSGVAAVFYPQRPVVSPSSTSGVITHLGDPVAAVLLDFEQDWSLSGPPSMPVDDWSGVMVAEVVPPTTGTYELEWTYDTGFRVSVNGTALMTDGWPGDPTITGLLTATGLSWTAGTPVRVRVDYWNYTGNAFSKLRWKVPGGSTFEAIPQSAIFQAYAPGSTAAASSGADYANYWKSAPLFTLFSELKRQDYFAVRHTRTSQGVRSDISGNVTSDPLYVVDGWRLTTSSVWTGEIRVERQLRSGAGWEVIKTWNGKYDLNIAYDQEENPDAIVRLQIINGAAHGTATTTPQAWLESKSAQVTSVVRALSTVTGTTFCRKLATHHVQALTENTAACAPQPIDTNWSQDWAEGAWSEFRGYPNAVELHNQRLCWAGNSAQPGGLWASAVGDFYNHRRSALADAAFQFNVVSQQRGVIQWLSSLRALHIGTESEEFTLTAADGEEGVSAINGKVQRHSAFGSESLAPIVAGGRLLFVQRHGRHLREVTFSQETGGYSAVRVTGPAGHLTWNGIQQCAWQEEPFPVLWIVTDGKLVGVTYEPDSGVVAWHRHPMANTIVESVAVGRGDGRDEVYISVWDSADEVAVRRILRLHGETFEALMPRPGDPPTDTFATWSTLRFKDYGDVSGRTAQAVSAKWCPARWEFQLQTGTSQSKKMRCNGVAFRLWQSAGTIGVRQVGRTPLGANGPIEPFNLGEPSGGAPTLTGGNQIASSNGTTLRSGEVRMTIESQHDAFLDLEVTHSSDAPLCILSIIPTMQVAQ